MDALRNSITAVAGLVTAFLLGALLLHQSGHDPLEAFHVLFFGAFGSINRIGETLVKATPLLMLGLAVSVAFRCQIWNIGVEGQFLAGAIASIGFGLAFPDLPKPLAHVLLPLAGFAGGALWGLLPAYLKSRLNVNEVITTLMMNYVAIYALAYLVRGPLLDPQGFGFPQSPTIAEAYRLPIILGTTRLHAGFPVALGLMSLGLIFWRTTLGYRFEVVGASRETARFGGIAVDRTLMSNLLISAGVAGLAGWSDALGIHHRLIDDFAIGYGNLGIVAALLGGLHPVGVAAASIVFASLVVGGQTMQRLAGIPFALVDVLQGLIILLIIGRVSLAHFRRRRRRRRMEASA